MNNQQVYPKYLLLFNFNKNEIARGSGSTKYDTSKSNLVCGVFSLAITVRIISIIYISLIVSSSLYFYLGNNDKKISKTNEGIEIDNSLNSTKIDSNTLRNGFLLAFNLITFLLLFVSSFSLDKDLASAGLFLFQLTFWAHLFLWVLLVVYIFIGKTEEIIPNYNKSMLMSILPFIFTLAILKEMYYIWICYKFTYNLLLGNDAYVCGEYFDKYVENLASSRSVSGLNSLCNTPKKNYDKFNDDYF